MPVYLYSGFQSSGQAARGSLEAASEQDAYLALQAQGVLPTRLAEESSRGAGQTASGSPARRRRASLARRTLFVRELATFLHADVPLLEALAVLARQEEDPGFKTVLEEVHSKVQGGESFSRALAQYPRIFPNLLVSMTRVGEVGGMLDKVLEQMAVWMEREEEVRAEIRGAMAYPLIILGMGVITVFILMSFVLPRITEIFSGNEQNLPLITRLMMDSSHLMGRWWWLTPLVAAGGVWAMGAVRRSPAGRQTLDRLSLALPIFGKLSLKASLARFARACAALLGAGVPLLEVLNVVRGLIPNCVIQAIVERTIQKVTRGHSLAAALGEDKRIPPSAIHLLAVGERTGRLPEMFERVAQTFERQTNAQVKTMLNLLSPLLIIALAVVVAIIALSILLPIFEMNKQLR